jgi:hypothetical protein
MVPFARGEVLCLAKSCVTYTSALRQPSSSARRPQNTLPEATSPQLEQGCGESGNGTQSDVVSTESSTTSFIGHKRSHLNVLIWSYPNPSIQFELECGVTRLING